MHIDCCNAQVIVTAISSSIIDRAGRRALLIYGAILMAIPCALLYLSYLSAPPVVPVASAAAHSASNNVALAAAANKSLVRVNRAAAAAAVDSVIKSGIGSAGTSSLLRSSPLTAAAVAPVAAAAVESGGGLLAHPLLPIAALTLYMVGFSIGWGPVPMLLMSELLPSRYRNLGSSMAVVCLS